MSEKKFINIVPFNNENKNWPTLKDLNYIKIKTLYMALSDLELDYISKYLSTAVNKVCTTMSVVSHHLLLRLFIMNLHTIDFKYTKGKLT